MTTRTLSFFGGAASTTGSMILLEAAGARVLLDAGLFEGDLAEAAAKNRELPLDPTRVDAILLSQAGLAHAGRVPQLVRHGFKGTIYATPATRDLAAVLHTETALSHASNPQTPYCLADVVTAQSLTVGQPYHRAVHLRRNLVFEFADAGHFLGSASIELRTGEGGSHRIVYSGSLGRPGSPLLRDPEPLPGEVDTLIIGGPFAHTQHPMFAEANQQLAKVIRDTVEKGGQIIVPAASVGPVHEFIRAVQELWRRGAIPEIPIWLDTPAPISHSTVLRLHPDALPRIEQAYGGNGGPFDQALVRQAAGVAGRDELDSLEGPALIVAPSEMGDTGRAAHHLRRILPDFRNTVLQLSFQEEGSVGHQLEAGAESVSIEGIDVEVRARIESLAGYSGLADGEELRGWIRSLGGPIKRAFVVHGDDLSVAMLVTILREEGVRDVIVPREGESFPF
ncbi:MAG TPA: MBL fold metallo-hydrolase [Gemmatimonadales bacterium]|nr:MBL fold metallo-hydrolase [Gemmatimonadales bacterium]